MASDKEFAEQGIKLLFVCSQNKLRSRTAENVFAEYPRLHVKSAGTDKDATIPITNDLLEWADIIFVMEKRHRNIIHKRYKEIYEKKRIICLYIPDAFDLMDPRLIDLLKESVERYIALPG